MECPSPSRSASTAGRAAPAIIAAAAVASTAVFFVLFTLPGRRPPEESLGGNPAGAPGGPGGMPAPGEDGRSSPQESGIRVVAAGEADPVDASTATAAAGDNAAAAASREGASTADPSPQDPGVPSVDTVWRTHEQAAAWIIARLVARDPESVEARFLGRPADPPAQRAMLAALAIGLESGRIALDPSSPPREIGRTGNATRWAFPLRGERGGDRPVTSAVEIDLVAKTPGRGAPLGLAAVRVPRALVDHLGSDGAGTRAEADAGDAGPLHLVDPDPPEDADALAIADRFLAAVLEGDVDGALRLSTGPGPDAPTAGAPSLAEILLAGGFRAASRRPLIATRVDENLAWVIARVIGQDAESGGIVEIGLELTRLPGGPWRVAGVRLPRELETGKAGAQGSASADSGTYSGTISTSAG